MTANDIPHIPDDVTLPQFIFGTHYLRPSRPKNIPWLIDDESGLRYGESELKERSLALSSALQKRFLLKSDDVVVLFSGNHIDYPICIWAIQQLLGIVSPINPGFTVPELTTHLRAVKASVVITHSDVLPTVEKAAQQVGIPLDRIVTIDKGNRVSIPQLLEEGRSLPPPREFKLKPGDNRKQIAFLTTSSGTTGPPKVVKISHYAVIANVLLVAAHNKVHLDYTQWPEKRYRVGDSCFAVLPLYRECLSILRIRCINKVDADIYGLDLILHFNIFAGMSVVIAPKFNFAKMLSSIVRHRITHLMIVPPQVVLLCKDPIVKNYDLSGVRVVLCAASALPAELYEQLSALLPHAHIGQAYGSTEVTGVASMCPIGDKKNPYGGTLIPGVTGKVIKPDGSPAAPNEEGELLIRTIASASGYLDNEAATKETFLDDGWIRSGDIVRIDGAGNIVVVDRVKEMIKARL
ncbi:hypothetical protein E1B28_007709 [Marasmius oreades]|uniref:AMP-dependent synthetase/ligase domain-containing protein n=1 Tax=Marasmius oreades TaxID=181124 RepID=A0A9P7S2V5_9AGAR|nr:uncharacterized protein E1B28_007709 [Marasmius oreades]KAG7094090.1 hypothetical protein E1B28_007709 [Marasmius oreades]